MASFEPYLSLSVTHSYHSALSSTMFPVTFVCTKETQRWIIQQQMFVRVLPCGLCIFLDQQAKEHIPPPNIDIELQFKLYSQDPYFRNYTETPLSDPFSIAYFDIILSETSNLTANPTIWQNIELFQNIVQTKDLTLNLIGVINLTIPAKHYQQTNKHITLNYSHTEAYWQYYLLSIPKANDYFITNPNNSYAFKYIGEQDLNHRKVMTFRSITPLPLLKHSNTILQLRNANKIFFRRLPLASPDQMEIISSNGNKQRLCHIYVP